MGVGKLACVTVATFSMAGLAMPAQAQSWHPEHRRHKQDKFDVGDAIVGGLVVGGLLALVSSSKKKQREDTSYDAPPPERVADVGPEGVTSAPQPVEPGSGPIAETPAPDSARFDGLYDEDAAADRCAMEAESLGAHYARLAQVSAVSSTVWNGKSWLVKGQLQLSRGYRDQDREAHGFRCALRRGAEPVVTIEGLQSAAGAN
ncbi:hypothetical protein [Sphingomonas sp. KR3-1]|uniref:hypothetical protein n=1 Tax=Sphingomonas sp. KR3-1 TaxID=3156611 RepID=UPI0032B552D7